MTKTKLLLATVAGAIALTGCASTGNGGGADGRYATPIGGAPVTANPTPYSEALVCLANYAHANGLRSPRIAVGRLADYTGRASLEGGAAVTQGASLMAISAFAKAGVRLVERFDTSVSELELRYANNQLIRDTNGQQREIHAASLPGSDYHLVGGITELNYNIRSNGVDLLAGDRVDSDPTGLFSRRAWVMNIGLDLRLNDTRTMETVDVISYQKQIIGREVSLGIFDFANGNVFDVGVGGRAQEPIQLAIRSVVERAVLEMMANLYAVPSGDVCAQTAGAISTNSVTGDFVPRGAPLEEYNGPSREVASNWHSKRDTSLRGRN